MVIKLMDIVVKPLIIHFSGSFFSKNCIFPQENERSWTSKPLNQKIALENFEFWKFEISDVNLE